MTNQFARTQLLIGKEGLNKLKSSHVAIFGIGGVGGHVLEALVRSGLHAVDIIDNDKVAVTNLNRQIIAVHSTLGSYKVDAAKARMLDINPNLKIRTYKTFFTPETANEFDFSSYDYIIDAIDTVAGKLALIEKAKEYDIPIICAMGAGNKMNPAMFEVADISKTSVCPLARVIRGELKKRKIKNVKVVYSKEPPIKPNFEYLTNSQLEANEIKHQTPASNAFCPSVMGLIIASEVVKDLTFFSLAP